MQSLPQFDDANLIAGARGFSDAGVYRLRDDLLMVQSLDFFPPLVDDPFVFGQIAAANALSDVYAMAARPAVALNIACFPDDELDLSILEEILRGGADRVRLAGAVIAGGHTVRDAEIKYGLSVTGVVEPDGLVTNAKARPGDALVLTKALGTGFVTTAFKAGTCPDEVLQAAVAGMVELNAGASEAAQAAGAHAMTDVTGFGLAGHATEMAAASGVTLEIGVGRVPVIPGSEDLARSGNRTRASRTNRAYAERTMRVEGEPDELRTEFLFDAQTSGGLLISVPAERAGELVERAGGAAYIVGGVRARSEGVSLVLKP